MGMTPQVKMRSHKINILHRMSKYFILLLIPLLHALFTAIYHLVSSLLLMQRPGSLSDFFYQWWFDLSMLVLILLIGVYAWFVFVFSIDERGITVEQGILLRQKSFFPFARVTAMSVEHPWYFRPFGIAYLTVDTNGGNAKQTDFSVWIHADRAGELLEYYHTLTEQAALPSNHSPSSSPKTVGMLKKHILFFSLITSSSLTGVLYLYAILKQTGNFLGEEFSKQLVDRFTWVATFLSFGAPPLLSIVAYTMVISWAISFLFTLLRYLRFSITRTDSMLRIKIGLFSPRRVSIVVKRINFVFLRQSLAARLLGIASVFLHCAGYGKDKKDFSVLIPAGGKTVLSKQLETLLPEFSLAPRSIRPRINDFTRFITVPTMILVGVLVGAFLGFHFTTRFDTIIWIALFVLGIPALLFLLVKIYAFSFSGIGVDDDAVTLYYTKGFQIITSMIPLSKITSMELSQAVYHHTTGACHLSVYTMAEKTQKQTVVNLQRVRVEELLIPHLMPYLRMEQISAEDTTV